MGGGGAGCLLNCRPLLLPARFQNSVIHPTPPPHSFPPFYYTEHKLAPELSLGRGRTTFSFFARWSEEEEEGVRHGLLHTQTALARLFARPSSSLFPLPITNYRIKWAGGQ